MLGKTERNLADLPCRLIYNPGKGLELRVCIPAVIQDDH